MSVAIKRTEVQLAVALAVGDELEPLADPVVAALLVVWIHQLGVETARVLKNFEAVISV